MSGTKYDYERIEQLRRDVPGSPGLSWEEIADMEGAPSVSSLRGSYYRWRDRQRREGAPTLEDRGTGSGDPSEVTPDPAPADPPADAVGNTVTASDIARITSLDDLIRFFQVDTEAWDVKSYWINKWEQASGGGDDVTITPLYQVKASLERSAGRREEILAQMRDEYLRDVADHAPVYRPIERATFGDDEGVLFTLAVMDPHFGMRAYGAELTGIDYDLKIVEEDFAAASRDLLGFAWVYNTERILIPIGNDGLHVDAPGADGRVGGQTTRGTPQDTDTRLAKMYSSYRRALVKQIDMARTIAPVDVILVPGNHARLSEYHMIETLAGWYRNDPEVNVRVDPGIRQFYSYGPNTFMYTHGEEVHRKRNNLAMIFADECPVEQWVSSDHRVGGVREIHTGHLHGKLRGGWYPTGDILESRGIRLRGLSGLTATDAWHHEKGYRHQRAATALVYRKTGGCAGEHEFTI